MHIVVLRLMKFKEMMMSDNIDRIDYNHVMTDESIKRIRALSQCTVSRRLMAEDADINLETLNHFYDRIITQEIINCHARVGNIIYNQALSGNMTAAIWYTKTQMGWREKTP